MDQSPDSEAERAREIALRYLTSAARSRQQVAQKLTAADIAPETITEVLNRFEEVGLLDDQAFADMLVRTRQQERGLARRGLAHELQRYGIEGETAQQALAQIDDEAEVLAARSLVERRLAGMSGLDHQRRRRRLAGLLGRRGYPPGVARRVIDEVLAEYGEAQD